MTLWHRVLRVLIAVASAPVILYLFRRLSDWGVVNHEVRVLVNPWLKRTAVICAATIVALVAVAFWVNRALVNPDVLDEGGSGGRQRDADPDARGIDAVGCEE